MMIIKKNHKKDVVTELFETLEIKYKSKSAMDRNPKLKYTRIYNGYDNIKGDLALISNGKRNLFVRTNVSPKYDSMLKDSVIKKKKDKFVLEVKNRDTLHYTKLINLIDKVLKIK